MDKKEQPLILVFYMFTETLTQDGLMEIVTKNVETLLNDKGVDAAVFYVPTDEYERIECINPAIATEAQMDRINKIIDDIAVATDIGQVNEDDFNLPEGL